MPYSTHLKGHVTYYTIALYFVEFSLITKSKWERNIVRSKIATWRKIEEGGIYVDLFHIKVKETS